MSSVNKVIIIGNVGQDPEVRYTSSGAAVCNLSVATSYKAKGKDEETEWHRCSLFERTAEVAGEYVRKGSKVYVEGRLRTRKYEDKEGVTRYVTEILGDRLVLLGERTEGGGQRRPERRDDAPAERPRRETREPERRPARDKGEAGFDDMDDDIPW